MLYCHMERLGLMILIKNVPCENTNIPGQLKANIMNFGGWCTLYIVPPFARPIPSVHLSVRDLSEHAVKTVRDRLHGYWGAYRKSPPGYSKDPSSTPYDHLFPQTGGAHLPVKICIAMYQLKNAFLCTLFLCCKVSIL